MQQGCQNHVTQNLNWNKKFHQIEIIAYLKLKNTSPSYIMFRNEW